MSEIDIAYKNNNFFYKDNTICNKDTDFKTPDSGCSINKSHASKLSDITKTHIVSNERLNNIQNKYNDTILLTVNLGIGIVFSGLYLFFNILKLK